MEVTNYIRSKIFPNDQMFELFNVVRKENAIESLIDYIYEKMSECLGAESKISELESNVEERDEKIAELEIRLKEINENNCSKKSCYEEFNNFVDTFKKDNDRYPSIDEAWDAAWESFEE